MNLIELFKLLQVKDKFICLFVCLNFVLVSNDLRNFYSGSIKILVWAIMIASAYIYI